MCGFLEQSSVLNKILPACLSHPSVAGLRVCVFSCTCVTEHVSELRVKGMGVVTRC